MHHFNHVSYKVHVSVKQNKIQKKQKQNKNKNQQFIVLDILVKYLWKDFIILVFGIKDHHMVYF